MSHSKARSGGFLSDRSVAFWTIAGSIATILIGAFTVVVFFLSNSGPHAPAASSGPVITVQQPTSNIVSRSGGFTANGSVSNLGADTIWLFDHDAVYYIDVKATVSPDGSTWSATDRPLGSANESLPFEVTALVVVANPQCTSNLQARVRSNETTLPNLPPGCHVAQPFITVTVNRE